MSVIYKLSNTKSTIPARVKSVGKNVHDIINNETMKSRATSTTEDSLDSWEISDIGSGDLVLDFFPTKFKKNTQYTISGKFKRADDGRNPRFRFIYSDGTTSSDLVISNGMFTQGDLTSAMDKTIDRIGVTYTSGGGTIWVDKNSFMIEPGDTATAYEPYTETTQYLPTDVELRSLPNGVKDETSASNGKLDKRVSDEVSVPLSGWIKSSVSDAYTNIDIYFKDISDGIYPFTSHTKVLKLLNMDWVFIASAPSLWQDDTNIKQYTSISRTSGLSMAIYISVPKGENPPDGLSLIYQLATPEVIDIPVLGNLLGHPSGTIYRENAIGEVGFYDDGLSVSHEDLPIHEIDFIDIVNKNDGTKTRLDKATAVISGDKKSFTHPQLSNGDLVSWDYYYPKELSTVGEATYGYFDSRFVVIDSVNSKAYRWQVDVADGVPSLSVVEV